MNKVTVWLYIGFYWVVSLLATYAHVSFWWILVKVISHSFTANGNLVSRVGNSLLIEGLVWYVIHRYSCDQSEKIQEKVDTYLENATD